MNFRPDDDARLAAALEELRALYARLDAELAPYSRPCRADGVCCRFGPDRPVLYVTVLEAAMMRASGRKPNPRPDPPGACPYLDGDRCGIREYRALGCRTYFCDKTFEEQRDALYEKHIREIRRIEERYGIEIGYAPLTGRREAAAPLDAQPGSIPDARA